MTQQLPNVPAELPPLADKHVLLVPAGTPLARVHDTEDRHPRRHDEPRWFGPLPDKGRLDHHPAGAPDDHQPDHGVIYVALDDPARSPTPATASGHVLDVVCAEWAQDGRELVVFAGTTLTVFRTSADLRLLDVPGPWGQLTRTGTHLSGAPHEQTQPWARAIRRAYPQLHGILYVPSTGGRAVAAALNEGAVTNLHGPVELSRKVAEKPMLDIVDEVGRRLGFSIWVI